ncbi:extracellular serine proteinase-like [Amphiura filiformis]|uniref:extracellular serine proteinase-like n=1 Tax=Amphiura filiformis TaxID=82378 RepID=UPI003B216FFB
MEKLILLLSCLIGLSCATAPLKKITSPIANHYIVVLKNSGDVDRDRQALSKIAGVKVNQEYRRVLKGFGVQVKSQSALDEIRENRDVQYVQQDGNVTVYETAMTWGLDRIDQRNLPLDGQSSFNGDGSGVNVYIIDTGVYQDHQYFGGRARFAYDATDEEGGGPVDCNGHGTHCAGTIGADYYGIARGATLHGVKVLSCQGWGYWSWVIAGMEFVANNHISPAVASMSLGGGANDAIDEAIQNMYDAGVTVAVAAGNSDYDACYYSPAKAQKAVTVGATDHEDKRAYFSNYGTCVDIFAPGVDVLSTMIGSPTATGTFSGTSMACPHVAGVMALILGNDPTLEPKDVWNKLKADSTSGVLQDTGPGSPDKMLYVAP